MQPRSTPPGSTPSEAEGRPASTTRTIEFSLDGFAWAALTNEAEREGVAVEELVGFAVLYYLADIDSGRVSRDISLSPRAGSVEPPQTKPDAGSPPPDDAAL